MKADTQQHTPQAGAFTPGPWRIGYADESEQEALSYDTITITPVRNDGLISLDTLAEVTFEDDARLIAAAPCLLAALTEMLAEIEYNEMERHDGHPRGCGWVRVCTKARAVIRRATPVSETPTEESR